MTDKMTPSGKKLHRRFCDDGIWVDADTFALEIAAIEAEVVASRDAAITKLVEKWRGARKRQQGYAFGSEFANNVRRECADELESCIKELEATKGA
jgi:hypothetical protein